MMRRFRADKNPEEVHQDLTRRYREVALFEAADKAIGATIGSVLGEQLAPLASEVNRRWQTVFPDRPNLALMPDGTMSRDAGGFPLAFTAFSAGEKIQAAWTGSRRLMADRENRQMFTACVHGDAPL